MLTLILLVVLAACLDKKRNDLSRATSTFSFLQFLAQSTGSANYQGLYCGATSALDGNRGTSPNAYSAVKSLCETVCGSSGAFVCNVSDIARSAQMGLAPTDLANSFLGSPQPIAVSACNTTNKFACCTYQIIP